jgi:Restriction endonuclease XhoI
MSPTLDQRFAKAVQYFWRVRSTQGARQGTTGGSRDAGERTAVTGGGHCRGFANLICELLVENGISDFHVFFAREKVVDGVVPSRRPEKQKGTELPGFFRATKDWDLIVVAQGELIAGVEFKSQVGPSFGNNFNNRTEEAIGNATDLQVAFREGAFKLSKRPWLGFFMLLEECPKSVSPVAVQEPHFPVFPEFKGASYAKRYELLSERLVREQLYNAACFVLSSREGGPRGKYTEPNKDLSFRTFISSLIGHATAIVKAKEL